MALNPNGWLLLPRNIDDRPDGRWVLALVAQQLQAPRRILDSYS
jgi:hypothetical protein